MPGLPSIAAVLRFALIAFSLLPVSGYLIARFGKSLRKTSRQGQAKMSDLYTLIQETIAGAPVVKAFQREDYEKARFEAENRAYFDIYMRNARVESLSSPVMEFLGAIGMGVILWFGGKDVVDTAEIAKELGRANPGGAYEIRPVGLFFPGKAAS